MKGNWDQCFQMVLKNEGGFSNNPRDPGGMTNLGVTKRAWENWVGHTVNEDFMRNLTPEKVNPFYKAQYWDRIKGDQLPAGIDYALYDFAVNSGVMKASKTAQEIAGVPADGVIGQKSIAAIIACNPHEVADAICDMRLEFLKRLSTFDTFGKGWTDRVGRVKAKALSMAKEA